MRRFVGIFSVSVIAIMAACNVFAATSDDVADSNIASVGYVKGAIEDLDVTDTAVTGQVVTKVSQTDGKIAVSRGTVSYNNLTDKPALKTVATTGSYNDLTNKPTIPAAQVQPDWNATTGMGAIKNKPTLGSLAAKSSVTNADIADGANIAAAKIATTKAGTGYDNMGEEAKKTAVPTVELTENIADTAAGTAVTSALKNYQPKATANYQMGNSEGKWTTMSANQQNALNSGITSGKVSTYDGYATGKVNVAQGTSAASKAVVTDASGNVTTGQVVSGMIADNAVTSAKIANRTITTSDISASAGITKGQLASAVQASLDKADKALQAHQDISGKVNVAQGSTAASKAVITNASGNITTGQVATGMIADNAVTSAKIASDAVTSAKIKDGTITNADIAAAAAIAPTKVAATKAGTEYDNMGETAKETAIPTVQLAENIADTAAGVAVSSALKSYQPTSTAVTHTANTAVGSEDLPVYVQASGAAATIKVDTQPNVESKKLITSGGVYQAIKDVRGGLDLDSTVIGVTGGAAATGKVVTSVTKSGRNVAATMDYVKIPVGSATAPTSVASIWVE